MKSDCIEKLYQGLSYKEMAVLSFKYLVDGNEVEADKVLSTVQWESYRCPNMEYRNWLDGLFYIAYFWGLAYWEVLFQKSTALACALASFDRENFGQPEQNIERCALWESRLLALENVLQVFCDQHGIEIESIRRITGAKPVNSSRDNIVADAKYQADMQIMMDALIHPLGKNS